MEINPEIFFEKSPKPISFENTEKILSQMKNCICKIHKNNGEKRTGFFCKIPYTNQSKLLTVLITNNHVLNENDLKNNNIIKYTLKDDKQIRKIKIDNNKRKIYTSKELDITFIEIKQNEDNINEFLEIDEELINKNKEFIEATHKNKSIYILHYPHGEDIAVSYGILDKINNEEINHLCNTSKGSSGSPILSLDSFKVIGIHCGSSKDENENCNKGIFIKYPIKEFNKKNRQNKIIFNLSYKIDPYWFKSGFEFRIFGDEFVTNHYFHLRMIINDKEYPLSSHVNKHMIVKESFEIKLIEIETITNMNNDIFYYQFLNSISNMSYMFYNCGILQDITKWDISNINNMSYMFYNCKNIPDISKWNTSNVIDMSYMFYSDYLSNKDLPDISKWNTSNVRNMSYMFYNCENIPDISKWDTSNVTDMSYMFYRCKNLPDISNWNTFNVSNMEKIFLGCEKIPDISKWDTSHIFNFSLSILKSSPINVRFITRNGYEKRINIIGDDFMTFSNLIKKFKLKANEHIPNNYKNIRCVYNGMAIDPNSNKLLIDLGICNNGQITCTFY